MFKKLREVCRKNFHLVAPLKTSVVKSDVQNTPELHDYLHHDYFYVSVWKISRMLLGNVPDMSPDVFRIFPRNFVNMALQTKKSGRVRELSRTFPGNSQDISGDFQEMSGRFPGKF